MAKLPRKSKSPQKKNYLHFCSSDEPSKKKQRKPKRDKSWGTEEEAQQLESLKSFHEMLRNKKSWQIAHILFSKGFICENATNKT